MENENQRIYQTTESNQTPEKRESAIDNQYEAWITEHNPVNSGLEALIYHIPATEAPGDLANLLKGKTEWDSAVKVLKIYKPEKAKHEYELQSKAYSIVAGELSKNPSAKLARIPKPLDNREIVISDDSQRILNQNGAKLSAEKAGLIAMDYIPGRDLQHIFYEWIVKHAPEQFSHIKNVTDAENFEQLNRAVSVILEFGQLAPRGTDEADSEIHSRRQKVINFLKRTHFHLHPSIVESIHNTRQLLEKNGFYHNDDHERNFMVSGDPTDANGPAPQTYMIDFSAAGSRPNDEEIKFIIEEQLKEILRDDEGSEQGWAHEIEAKVSNPTWVNSQEGFFQPNDRTLRQRLDGSSWTAASSEQGFENYVAVMLKLVRDGRLPKSEAVNYLNQIRDRLQVKDSAKKPSRIINPNIFKKAAQYKELFK